MTPRRCLHLPEGGERPWAIVSLTPIPWPGTKAEPHCFYTCFACAAAALSLVRSGPGALGQDSDAYRQRAEAAEHKLAALRIWAGESEVLSGDALRALLDCPPDNPQPLPPWVEQLASEWEARGAPGDAKWAADLRVRAKGLP